MTALPQTCCFGLPRWPQEEGGLGQAGPGGTAHLRSAFSQELSLAYSPTGSQQQALPAGWEEAGAKGYLFLPES